MKKNVQMKLRVKISVSEHNFTTQIYQKSGDLIWIFAHLRRKCIYKKLSFKRPIACAKKLTFLTSSWNVDGTVIQNFNKINCCHYIDNEEISDFNLLNVEIKLKNSQVKTYILHNF